MDILKLTDVLEDIAKRLEIKGENPFKARAYRNAAEIIRTQKIDPEKEIKNETLGEVKGFGEALVKKITEFYESGRIEYYEKLKKEIPDSLTELTKISGLGPRGVKKLKEELGVLNIDDLEKACEEGRVAKLKGFGEKKQEEILNSVAHRKAEKGKNAQTEIREEAEFLMNFFKNSPFAERIEKAGKSRRFSEVIEELEFVVETSFPEKLAEELEKKFGKLEISEKTIRFKTKSEISVAIYLAEKSNFSLELFLRTGSEKFLKALRAYADSLGENFFENALGREFSSEKEIFDELRLSYLPPETREGEKAVEAAKRKAVPKLIEEKDLKGVIHVHSNWSDGRNSIEEMALECKRLGFEYVVICDHSASAVYANGLSYERALEQRKEIDKLNEKDLGITIIQGIESDILKDGSLDYTDKELELFDVVAASVHSFFKMSKAEMTKRIVKALRHKKTSILGHPTGRLLLARPAYEIDIKEIIDVAADNGKTIEMNSNPYRLDLSWENAIYAKEKGVKIAINPDSHRTSSLKDVFLGVKAARKAWLEKQDVANALDVKSLLNLYHY